MNSEPIILFQMQGEETNIKITLDDGSVCLMSTRNGAFFNLFPTRFHNIKCHIYMSKKSIRFFNDREVRAVWDDENN